MKTIITGLGIISALGTGCASTLDSLRNNKRNISFVNRFATSLNKFPVFQVDLADNNFAKLQSKSLAFLLTAVEEAVNQSQLKSYDGLRIGVTFGTTVASQFNNIHFYKKFRAGQNPDTDVFSQHLKSNLAEAVSEYYGFNGPCITIANACSSGTDCIGLAKSWIDNDLCDIVIAGGADELILTSLAGFNALNVYSELPCSPFDKNRKGLNLGEGAGVLVLERDDIAKKRGVKPLLQCMGYASFADAYHITAARPDGSGLIHAINKSLTLSGLSAYDICLVNAHGTATPNNDLVEGKALNSVFSNTNAKIYSTKGFTGHTLGAAGGIEAVLISLALLNGWASANAGFENIDPEIGFSPITECTKIDGKYALSTSLAFGGLNSAVIIGKL